MAFTMGGQVPFEILRSFVSYLGMNSKVEHDLILFCSMYIPCSLIASCDVLCTLFRVVPKMSVLGSIS